MITLVFSYGL